MLHALLWHSVKHNIRTCSLKVHMTQQVLILNAQKFQDQLSLQDSLLDTNSKCPYEVHTLEYLPCVLTSESVDFKILTLKKVGLMHCIVNQPVICADLFQHYFQHLHLIQVTTNFYASIKSTYSTSASACPGKQTLFKCICCNNTRFYDIFAAYAKAYLNL